VQADDDAPERSARRVAEIERPDIERRSERRRIDGYAHDPSLERRYEREGRDAPGEDGRDRRHRRSHRKGKQDQQRGQRAEHDDEREVQRAVG